MVKIALLAKADNIIWVVSKATGPSKKEWAQLNSRLVSVYGIASIVIKQLQQLIKLSATVCSILPTQLSQK